MLENFKPSDIQSSVESTKDNSLKMPEVKDLPPLGGKENPLKTIKSLPKVEDLPPVSKSEVKNELTPLSEESKKELKEQEVPFEKSYFRVFKNGKWRDLSRGEIERAKYEN